VHQGGFRVSFSGTSADELFTGYYDHFILHLNEMRSEEDYPLYVQNWSEHVGRFVRNPDLKNPNLYHQDPNFRAHVFDASDELKGFFLQPFIEDFVEENFTDSLLRNRMLNELFHEATPVILHEDDLNSMYYSVENRSPYLDRNLLGFVNSIPSRHLIQNGYGKYILREALKGTLNEQVRLDRRKKGFNASINSIVKLEDQETRDYLLDPSAQIFEIIDRTQIIPLLDQFPIPNHLSKFIFNFINARIFLELN
jgi:asparagine synthase (glutamine-hydrolysing)